ncbi:MAG: tRNA (adenosine(37)-N6)-threonylcarbamoyltransferase complex ATPase subunit type 1 TsaE [bacterium]|nr:tRNA (adenosine(37)-N6)-threonylcarbamoyltransferase complex ATPase subunit type 1 TsaE [bacterium]
MAVYTTHSAEETRRLARSFAKKLGAVRQQRALVVGLYGNLGSGKTTFTQGLIAAFGVKEDVTSPTFVIEKIYKIKGKGFSHIIHIDAYRLRSADELKVLGWKEIEAESGNLIVVEWPEHVAELLSRGHLILRFSFINHNERIIEIDYGSPEKTKRKTKKETAGAP